MLHGEPLSLKYVTVFYQQPLVISKTLFEPNFFAFSTNAEGSSYNAVMGQ